MTEKTYNPWLTAWKGVKTILWPALLVALPAFLAAMANDKALMAYFMAHPWGLVVIFLIAAFRNYQKNK